MKYCVSFLCGMALMLCGCRQEAPKPDGFPELYPVVLQIQQSGQPLADAHVVLYATETENSFWVSGGGTDASGNVVIRTHGNFEGCPAGQFKVCVSKTETEGDMTSPASPIPGAQPAQTIWNLVEPKYQSPTKTPIMIEVRADQDNHFAPIDVGKEVRIKQGAI